jgi:hypothetical protein
VVPAGLHLLTSYRDYVYNYLFAHDRRQRPCFVMSRFFDNQE